jgi:AcrR family transcriptional regulator
MAASPDPPALAPSITDYKKGRVPREIREQHMLDVAEAVFAEFGYDAATIEEICRRADIKRPLFYAYFGSKEGLYLACYARARQALQTLITESAARVASNLPPAMRVRGLIDSLTAAYFAFLAESPNRWDMLYGPGAALTGELGQRVATTRDATVDLLSDLLRPLAHPGTDEATIQAFAHAVSGAAEHLARWSRRTPDADTQQLPERLSAFIWQGIAQLIDESAH